MATIQWRPEVNALTSPVSYKMLHVPRRTAGYAEMAADISSANPVFTQTMVSSLAPLIMDWILERLLDGEQVVLTDAFIFRTGFSGKLNTPDDAPPADPNLLQVNVRAAKAFLRKLRERGLIERLPASEKLPLISVAMDTLLKASDTVNAEGALRLTGSNLNFDVNDPACGCVIEGTRSGQTKQAALLEVMPASVLLLPQLPEQDNPWNNEFTLTLTARYSQRGSLRSCTYRRRLRSPIVWDGEEHEDGVGMLTGSANAPYVTISSGDGVTDGVLRVQAAYDAGSGGLLLSLRSLDVDGPTGTAVLVLANGDYTLPGVTGIPVNSLEVTVEQYGPLVELVRNGYAGTLSDVLLIRTE